MAQVFSPTFIESKKALQSLTQNEGQLSAEELIMHINFCALNNRESQKKIYACFYEYGMAICDRYSNMQSDSEEILNDGFLKIFKHIHRFKPAYTDVVASFRGWVRKIMVGTAIDHFRRNRKYRFAVDIDNGLVQLAAQDEDAVGKISYKEIMGSLKQLTPGYRTVFKLYVLNGFTHEEVSNRLGISIGTSKSNLAKARRQLQQILFRENQIQNIESLV